ncbi:MAG: hypothetical protein Q9177_006855, partial [Variospora cf. flavescens]
MTPRPEPLPRASLLISFQTITKSPPVVEAHITITDRGQSAAAVVMASQTLHILIARLCQNRIDIVAIQGEYLVPRAGTPVFEKARDDQFAAVLARKLKALTIVQI